MSKEHQVVITAEGGGSFSYNPSTLHVQAGDHVGWFCETGPFAISFMDQTPFHDVSFSSREKEKRHLIEPIQTRLNAIGHHHYAVAIASVNPPQTDGGPPTVKVLLDSGCPDIIVSNDGA